MLNQFSKNSLETNLILIAGIILIILGLYQLREFIIGIIFLLLGNYLIFTNYFNKKH
ncbi:MAG TPA: hypothetical protein PKD96_04690 [Candidatus Absconditabacterales bacterium]|nr:hypothetical protein [Candidatus Absconditabacterales bacterium]HMT27579.1 hypothetical protein [Candidatus Absconditabacterales bacterium]